MDKSFQGYSDRGITSVFVYVREAHPGELFPAHRNLNQKLSTALTFKQQFGIQRPILVDALEGTGHKLYGALPNMTYLINQGGKVLFRADWTDPPTIEVVLNYVAQARIMRREGLSLTPFYAEFIGYRWTNRAKVEKGHARGGQRAVEDLHRASKQWAQQGTRPGHITLEE